MFQPLEDRLVEAVSAQRAQHVLDVGCGTGSTTLAITRQLGANGSCLGIDISAPMLQTARERAEREAPPARF
ncbi:class I SAM-dependent methyltransferase, partial [Acinetobacter baumannii]